MATPVEKLPTADGRLVVAGRTYRSRLLVGTGKYRDFEETRNAIEASGAEIVTVALRRTNMARIPISPTCSTFYRPSNTRYCRIRRVATRRKMPYAPCDLRANCSTVTNS